MFRLTREATGLLKAGARGRVINVGSIMSDMAGPGLAAYGTSKHAVAGLTKAMAVDLGKYQITANYLQPGSIITALSEPFLGDPEFRSYWENKAPIGRRGEAEDVAAAALFLASDAAQFVTGVGFNVDGGAIVNF
jgi:NAD(P)-dependent dehydrogenase (short-subunit alcohol dehydrogenase family)